MSKHLYCLKVAQLFIIILNVKFEFHIENKTFQGKYTHVNQCSSLWTYWFRDSI